jgi:hypothetical protein
MDGAVGLVPCLSGFERENVAVHTPWIPRAAESDG